VSAGGIPRIVIVGGGPAALEALLALRDWLGPGQARICLLAPNRTLRHRPLSGVVEFATHPEHELSLASIAVATDAELVSDSVALVEPGRLLTHDGTWIAYDQLLIAIGPSERRLPSGWVEWAAQGEPQALLGLIGEIADAASATRIAVYVPATRRVRRPPRPAARPLLLGHPRGTAIQVTLPPSATVAGPRSSPAPADDAIEVARAHDAVQRQVFALQRLERAAGRRLEEMETELRRSHERSADVLERLNAAGYLVKNHPRV